MRTHLERPVAEVEVRRRHAAGAVVATLRLRAVAGADVDGAHKDGRRALVPALRVVQLGLVVRRRARVGIAREDTAIGVLPVCRRRKSMKQHNMHTAARGIYSQHGDRVTRACTQRRACGVGSGCAECASSKHARAQRKSARTHREPPRPVGPSIPRCRFCSYSPTAHCRSGSGSRSSARKRPACDAEGHEPFQPVCFRIKNAASQVQRATRLKSGTFSPMAATSSRG